MKIGHFYMMMNEPNIFKYYINRIQSLKLCKNKLKPSMGVILRILPQSSPSVSETSVINSLDT